MRPLTLITMALTLLSQEGRLTHAIAQTDSPQINQPGIGSPQINYRNRDYRIPGRRYGWHSPVDALASRVHAQADLIRSVGEASVDFAAARRIRADAVRAEYQNSYERVHIYWKRRNLGEAERARRRLDVEARRQRIAGKTWNRLKDYPELISTEISSGTALNFLFYRLSATALAWDPSNPPAELDSDSLNYLRLERDTLHRLQLQQTTGSSRFVFRADEGVPLRTDWWPYLLRAGEFREQREALQTARQNVIRDAQDGEMSVNSLKSLEIASVELSTEFRKRFDRERTLRHGIKSFREVREAEQFLQSLDLEIARLQRTGDASVFGGSLRFEAPTSGTHLPELLSFMARNGLKFAPAQPGDESAYFSIFQQLRDYYLAYDEESDLDESTEAGPERS